MISQLSQNVVKLWDYILEKDGKTKTKLDRDEPGFIKRLAESAERVFHVARWLHYAGATVQMPGMSYRNAPNYSDDGLTRARDMGDIWARVDDGAPWLRFEVKCLKGEFQAHRFAMEDAMFPVDTMAKIKRLAPNVDGWFILDHDLESGYFVGVKNVHAVETRTRAWMSKSIPWAYVPGNKCHQINFRLPSPSALRLITKLGAHPTVSELDELRFNYSRRAIDPGRIRPQPLSH